MNSTDSIANHWVASLDDYCIAHARESLKQVLARWSKPIISCLLSGPRRVGKTTLAVWMVRRRICLNQQVALCSEVSMCTSCRLLQTHSHPDVMVLGEDSTQQSLGIDDARRLINFFSLSAWSSSGRSVLVLGSERFTREASNALLKTIEEPPTGALILFTSSALERIPATVRSRLPMINLSRVDDDTLSQWATAKGIDHEAQTLIAARGLPGKIIEGIPQRVQEQIDWITGSLQQSSVQVPPLFDILKQGMHSMTNQDATALLDEWIEAFQGVLSTHDIHSLPTSTPRITQSIRLLERAKVQSTTNVSIDPLLYDLATSLEAVFFGRY